MEDWSIGEMDWRIGGVGRARLRPNRYRLTSSVWGC
jgi:hypothetical protein